MKNTFTIIALFTIVCLFLALPSVNAQEKAGNSKSTAKPPAEPRQVKDDKLALTPLERSQRGELLANQRAIIRGAEAIQAQAALIDIRLRENAQAILKAHGVTAGIINMQTGKIQPIEQPTKTSKR